MPTPSQDRDARIDVSVFGPVRAKVGEVQVKFSSQRSAHLLGYLVVHKARPRSPAAVAADFWPDLAPARSRKALNTELWRLRTAFESAGAPAPVQRDEVALHLTADCTSDFETFWTAADATLPDAEMDQDAIARAEAGIDVARGVLMEGCYDDWLLIPREMALAELNRRLSRLMDALMAANCYGRAIQSALKLIELDPLLEAPHRVIMRAHDLLGNRAAAMRQFQKLKSNLADELQVPPLEETVALYASIAGAERSARVLAPVEGKGDTHAAIIKDLLRAEKRVRRARLRLTSRGQSSATAI